MPVKDTLSSVVNPRIVHKKAVRLYVCMYA